jgi:probable F420-dependent oxidoreductase
LTTGSKRSRRHLRMTHSEIPGSIRERLGPVGVWLGSFGPASIEQERVAVRRIEELGYGSIWCGEAIGGKEAFAHQSVLLAATERIVTGTGIANVWARHPATMQGGAATLGAAYPDRFMLGVGISHASLVDRSGQTYERPLNHMARYLDGMDVAAVNGPATERPISRVLAALRPQMLALARDRADGAHTYFVPPSHTLVAREALGPGKLLIPQQAVVLNTDPDDARRIARGHTQPHLRLPNYVNNLKYLGYTDQEISAGNSDRLVDAIVARGDEAAIAKRVNEHLDAGADHVLLQPLGDLDGVLSQLENLAPAVLGA